MPAMLQHGVNWKPCSAMQQSRKDRQSYPWRMKDVRQGKHDHRSERRQHRYVSRTASHLRRVASTPGGQNTSPMSPMFTPGKAEWIGAISPIASFSSLVCADHDWVVAHPRTFGGIRPNTLGNAMAGTGQLNGSASHGARMLRTATQQWPNRTMRRYREGSRLRQC
jgi:hypothetical protein